MLDHRSLPPEFKTQQTHIWRVFHLWLRVITFGGHSARLAYDVHKCGCKTSFIFPKYGIYLRSTQMMKLIDALWPLFCTRLAKWVKRPPKVMKWSQKLNTLQIRPDWDSNSGGSGLWSNVLEIDSELVCLVHHYIKDHCPTTSVTINIIQIRMITFISINTVIIINIKFLWQQSVIFSTKSLCYLMQYYNFSCQTLLSQKEKSKDSVKVEVIYHF